MYLIVTIVFTYNLMERYIYNYSVLRSMNENDIIKEIKKLCVGFEDLSESEYKIRSDVILKLQDKLNEDETKHRALICTNCGLVTRSVFTFHEHYENDITGYCSDVCG